MRANTSRSNTRQVCIILDVPKTSLPIRQLKIFFPKLSKALKQFAFLTVITKFALKLRTTEVEGKLFITV